MIIYQGIDMYQCKEPYVLSVVKPVDQLGELSTTKIFPYMSAKYIFMIGDIYK